MKLKAGGILVELVVQSIQNWIYDNSPSDVELTDCQVRAIYNTYQLNCIEPDEKWQVRMAFAISRLVSQIDFERKCDCLPKSYFLRVRDKQALRRLVNNYCLDLADNYDAVPPFLKGLLTRQYDKMTQIMYQLQ